MTELNELIDTDKVNKVNKDDIIIEKKYKTPEYTRRAIRQYALRNKDDLEFKKKTAEIRRNYRQTNLEKMREYNRDYMREYRAKKKANKVGSENTVPSTDITDTINAIDSLAIKN